MFYLKILFNVIAPLVLCVVCNFKCIYCMRVLYLIINSISDALDANRSRHIVTFLDLFVLGIFQSSLKTWIVSHCSIGVGKWGWKLICSLPPTHKRARIYFEVNFSLCLWEFIIESGFFVGLSVTSVLGHVHVIYLTWQILWSTWRGS